MAFQFEQKVKIDRPVDEVFSFMANAENDAKWRTNVKDIRRVEGEPSGAGAVYEQRIKGPFGRPIRADLRHTDYEENRRLAFETINGAVRPSAVLEFAPVSEEATEVHFNMTWEPSGAMKLAGPLVARNLERGIRDSYANLVRHLESKPREPST